MNKALIVGIDHYDMVGSLHGAVNDAYAVKTVLERHADGTLNFAQPRMLAGTGPDARVTRSELRAAVVELFRAMSRWVRSWTMLTRCRRSRPSQSSFGYRNGSGGGADAVVGVYAAWVGRGRPSR